MLGRAAEVRRVSATVAAGASVLVTGVAGIGKTSVVRAALRGRPHAEGGALVGLRWRPYMPLMRAVGSALDGEVEAVATAVLGCLGDRVLFIDDLQWADPATVEVVGMLVGRVAVVATSRRVDDVPFASRTSVVELGPLPAATSRRLANRMHPELSPSEVARLVEVSAGSPLLLRHLVHDGVMTPTLRAALAARLEMLRPAAREALVEVAVHGRPIHVDWLRASGGELPRDLIELENGEVSLRHRLLIEATIDSLTPQEVAAAREGLAQRLPPDLAAEHLLACGAGDEAARCARTALVAGCDPVARAHLLSIAAEATCDDAAHVEAADALVRIGDWDAARRFASRVGDDDPTLAAQAALHLSRASWFAGDVTAARRAAEAGLAALDDQDHPLTARLLVESAHQRVRTEEAQCSTTPIAQEALAAAERLDVDVLRARNVLATALAHDGLPGWEQLYATIISDAVAAEDGETECSAAFFLASHLGFAGRYGEAIDLLESAIERATHLGELTWRDHMTGALLTDRFGEGVEPGRAVADARRFIAARPLFRNRAQAELVLILSLADLGRFDDAFAAVDAARAAVTSPDDQSILLTAATEAAWMAAELQQAIDLAAEAAGSGPGWFGITAGAIAAGALAQFERGEPVSAELKSVKVPIFAPFRSEVDALRAWSDGDHRRAIDLIDAVAARWGSTGPRRYRVRAQWTGGVMAARIRHPSAHGRLKSAECSAASIGLASLATRANRSLRALDPRPVTEREAIVLHLVADGLTSSDIARRLEISRTTVESHVAAAVRKLGARNRHHAASLLDPGTSP